MSASKSIVTPFLSATAILWTKNGIPVTKFVVPQIGSRIQTYSSLKDKTLFAGFVDGINIWKTDIKHAIINLDYLSKMTNLFTL